MSARLSFIADYYPAREAMLEIARVAATAANRHSPASGEALDFAHQVREQIRGMHRALLETMTCTIAPASTLTLKFEAQLAEICAMLPDRVEVTVPAMEIRDVPGAPEWIKRGESYEQGAE